MNSRKAFLWFLFLLYLVGLSQNFGILIGLYVSLLISSFFVLLTPFIAYIGTFVALFSRGDALCVLQRAMLGLWVFLLIVNMVTLIFFPVIYTKTSLTMFVHHMFLVPMAGMVPVIVTGLSAIYYWLIAQYVTSRMRIVWCMVGALGSSVAFHFFMKGFYFAQFIASLNSTAINY